MKKLFSLVTLIFGFSLAATSQDFFYAPEGKTFLEIDKQTVLIKFKDETKQDERVALLQSDSRMSAYDTERDLPTPKFYVAALSSPLTGNGISDLKEDLQNRDEIAFVNHFLKHEDGTLHGITDQVLVKLKSPEDYNTLVQEVVSLGAEIDKQNDFQSLVYHIKVDETSYGNALVVANILHETGLFDYAEPDFLRIMKHLSTNDPFVDDQWALHNDGVNTSQWGGTDGSDIKAFEAWNTSTGDADIRVAIIDEGVELTHPDLVDNLVEGYDATLQGSQGAADSDDPHGTACAGIVAASGDNNIGVAGVAYDCSIVPVRVGYSQGFGWVTNNSWLGDGISWAWDEGESDVLSNSWGGGTSSSIINDAIDDAVDLGRDGTGSVVLFASGNSNGSTAYPASYEPTIAVIAMSMCDERKSFSSCDDETFWGSNFGTNSDVAAPGVKIYTTDLTGSAGYSGTDYDSSFNGTSSACPNAAGVVALIFSVNPSLTGDEARDILESTCDKVGGYTYNSGVTGQPNGTWSTQLGYGRINAFAALEQVLPSEPDDAGITKIVQPTGSFCQENVSPIVTLRNFGINNLTSVDIYYSIDGGTPVLYNWTGNLVPSEKVDVTLANFDLTPGSHTIDAYTQLPNGETDTKPQNDDTSEAFYSGIHPILIVLSFDNFPEETSWEIRDASSNLVLEGGPYINEPPNSVLNISTCLSNGCFDFIMLDSAGDGMCCILGNGSYQVMIESTNEILASGSSFGFSETTNICVTQPNEECSGAIELTPNPDMNCGNFEGGSLLTATGSNVAENCNGVFDDDIWYFFQAVETEHEIQVNNIVGNQTDLSYQLLRGSCGGMAELMCHDNPDSGFTASNLTPNETYYLRVATTAANSNADTTFDICVGTFVASDCPTSLDLMGVNSGDGSDGSNEPDNETTGILNSTQLILSTAVVDYDSATEISLNPGFEVELGAVFEAIIDGCNNGGGGSN